MICAFLCHSVVLFIFLLEFKDNGNAVNKFALRIVVLQKELVLEKPYVPQSQNICPPFSDCGTSKYSQERIVQKRRNSKFPNGSISLPSFSFVHHD